MYMEIIADILGQNKKWVKRDKISRSYGLEFFFFMCVQRPQKID